MTVTGPAAPMRWARLIAWSSTAGFHQRSNRNTYSAELQVQAHAAGAVAHQQHVPLRVVAELLEHVVALLATGSGRDTPAGRSGSSRSAERVERCDPLAEDDRLAAAGGDFFQVGLQPFELASFRRWRDRSCRSA